MRRWQRVGVAGALALAALLLRPRPAGEPAPAPGTLTRRLTQDQEAADERPTNDRTSHAG